MASLLIAGSHPLPATPPLQHNVAPNYERFDGLDELQGQMDGSNYVSTSLGVSYGEQPDPGRLNAPFTRGNGIPGKVGSVGASPYPVQTQWGPSGPGAAVRKSTRVSQLTTQFNTGPGGVAPGLQQTLQLTEIIKNPPQREDAAVIFLGG
jgi:hypothetical protein